MLQVLIEFPCELVSAVVAGRWAASSSPLKPWLFGYQARLVMAAVVTAIVRPSPPLLPLDDCTSIL
jgi:PAT family acetyl-CoA transporter-like MFS transporter 1